MTFCALAWTLLFLSLWKDFQGRFAKIIESLKKQRDFVDTEAASLDIVEAKDSRARLQYEIERRQKESIEALERSEKNESINPKILCGWVNLWWGCTPHSYVKSN